MNRILTKAVYTAALIAVILLLPFSNTSATIPTGEWRTHLSYYDATKSLKAFNKIFVLSAGSIYSFSPEDNSLYIYDKIGGLSDTYISDIAYCNDENALLLIYSNGNIDILYQDETIYNFTDIKNSSITDKTIYDIYIDGSNAYLSTAFGVVVFNIEKLEISNNYNLGTDILSTVVKDNSIICATNKGLYKGSINDNLLDKSKWNKISENIYISLFSFDDKLIGKDKSNTICEINVDNGTNSVITNNALIVNYNDNKLLVYNGSALFVYNSLSDYYSYNLIDDNINHLFIEDSKLWISQGYKGLTEFSIVENNLVCNRFQILPDSPRRNYSHYITFSGEDKMLMVGGTHNYSNIEYEGTVMIYNNNRWNYLDDDISSKTGVKYINLTSIVEDPKEENHYFVGSGRHGLYEFKDNKFYKLHTYNNSGLTTIIPANPKNYVSVDGLKYDIKGNLWMVNNEIDTIIKIMKPDGNWKGLYYPEISGLPTFRKLDFDKNGRIWTNSSRYKAGMFCLDINNTLDNNDDDKHKFVGPTFTNQDGVSEIINDIFFFEFDKNGEMWLGTDRGIFVLREPEKFLSDDNVIFERVKIPRNDGTNLADYLLSGIYTTAICIDDANRKWIGTQNNGVFLLSEDGKETIYHFTEENSPLLSNYIQTIAINSSTGSVFFGTSLGLIEYGGDATEPENSLSESNIEVYPNPVNPDFDGPVTIKGMSDKCTVRIISASGSLVYQGYSNGGTFTWNVTDRNGNRVTSGIYHAIITDLNNSKSTSVSITVIR